MVGDTFPQLVKQAVEAALVRLFPKFPMADQAGWDKVVARASQGAGDALAALGYGAEVDKHAACQEVRTYVGGAGKKGSEVRNHFKGGSYGWPQDAVDGALLVLLAAGYLRASKNGQPVHAKGLIQSQIGVTDFFSEGVTISALQRIGVRNLATSMGLPVKNGEEPEAVQRILERLAELAGAAGGEPPLPAPPDDTEVKRLMALAGNEQFVAVHDKKDELLTWYKAWSSAADTVQERFPEWRRLEVLLDHARGLPVAAEVEQQVQAVEANRALLDNPNPVGPLIGQISDALRHALRAAQDRIQEAYKHEIGILEGSEEWTRLGPKDQEAILTSHSLNPMDMPDVGTDEALLAALGATSLEEWDNRIAALPVRAAKAREDAARRLEPKTVTVRPPAATLKSTDDVESYIQRLREELLAHIESDTPIVIL